MEGPSHPFSSIFRRLINRFSDKLTEVSFDIASFIYDPLKHLGGGRSLKLKYLLPEMVRVPYYVHSITLKRGPWSPDEDEKLKSYIKRYGIWNWMEMPKAADLLRSGKSCRLRWMNYLKPGIKRGNFTHEEEEIIIKLHEQMGNRWSAIAARLPGRTDNGIKNYWHTKLSKRKRSPAPRTESSLGNKPIGAPKAGSSMFGHPCSYQASVGDFSSSNSSLGDHKILIEGNFDNLMSIQPYACHSSLLTGPEVGTFENQAMMEGNMEAGITCGDFQAFPMEDVFLLGDYLLGTYPGSDFALPGCEEWVEEPLWV